MWSSIALLLLISKISSIIGGGVADNFVCYPNQTIQFTNPDSSLYTYFKAFYDNGTEYDCTVTTNTGKTLAYLDCASTTVSVTLYISDRDLATDDILSRNSKTYAYKCNEVPSYNETLSNDLNVNITETAESDTPEFNITSNFFDASSNVVTAATVGDTVYYIIKGPSEYDLKPLQCNATGSGDEHTVLIVDGCTQDSDLILDFEESTSGQENHYNASLYVFKFYNSDTLTLTCKVEVCSGTESCAFSCPAERRKRFVTISAEIKRAVADDGLKTTTFGNTLRILDAPLGGSQKMSGSSQFVSIILLFLITLFL